MVELTCFGVVQWVTCMYIPPNYLGISFSGFIDVVQTKMIRMSDLLTMNVVDLFSFCVKGAPSVHATL